MTERGARSTPATAVRRSGATGIARALPEETAVALVYNGTTQAVMMAILPERLRGNLLDRITRAASAGPLDAAVFGRTTGAG